MASSCTSRLFTKLLRCPDPMLPMPMNPMPIRSDGGRIFAPPPPMADEGTMSGCSPPLCPFFDAHPAAASAVTAPFKNLRLEGLSRIVFLAAIVILTVIHNHAPTHLTRALNPLSH